MHLPTFVNNIVAHVLFVVPLSLTEANGNLRKGSNTVLAGILTAGISYPTHLDVANLQHETLLVIEGQALVNAIGKSQAAKTLETFQTSL